MEELTRRGIFQEYSIPFIKNKYNELLMEGSEQQIVDNKNLNSMIQSIHKENCLSSIQKHAESVRIRNEMIQMRKDEKERRRLEEEARLRIELAEKLERKRVRQIKRLRRNIQKNIIEAAVNKGEYYNEEISEIDNLESDSPFIGIYGGLLGSMILSMSILKRSLFPIDQLFTMDNISEILSLYLSESGPLNIYFNINIEDEMKAALERDDLDITNLDINNLKSNTELRTEDWLKIGEILSRLELQIDPIVVSIVNSTEPLLYSYIIQALCSLLEKGMNLDKINFIFRPPLSISNNQEQLTLPDYSKKYVALCIQELSEHYDDILNNVEFVKDKKKKPIKVPEFDNDIKISRYFQRTDDIKDVLIYDKYAEFVIRNKVLENCLKILSVDFESKQIFKTFNEMYEQELGEIVKFENMHIFSYKVEAQDPNM
jgi:hypothetical protein